MSALALAQGSALASVVAGALGIASGSLVGFVLGLVGGGGSILAVPLLLYLVGVPTAHVAIGTAAVAVAASAAINLAAHARAGTVKWRCASLFAVSGMVGAAGGAQVGKMLPGDVLIGGFAILMLVVAALMLRRKSAIGDGDVRLGRENALWLVGIGLGAGALSGLFGIGGGFLIVPGLLLATGMPMLYAVGSSLVAVTAFGATTAASYALSGLVDWTLAALFVAGAFAGGMIGTRSAKGLSAKRGALERVFAALIVAVAAAMLASSLGLF